MFFMHLQRSLELIFTLIEFAMNQKIVIRILNTVKSQFIKCSHELEKLEHFKNKKL